MICSVSSLSLCSGNPRRGMPLHAALIFCFRRVDITQRGASRVVLLLCHVRKDGPRGGIQLCCLREIKTAVLRYFIMIAFAFEHSSACGDSLDCDKS